MPESEVRKMKALIVYYSLEGSTKLIAQELKSKLGADVLELVPSKAYPTGKVSKFLFGGKSAVMSETPVLEPYSVDMNAYGTVILGTPVWASRCAPPLRTFLEEQSLLGKKVAAYACAAGKSAGKTFEQFEQLCGGKLVHTELFTAPAEGRDPEKDSKLEKLAAACK